MQAQRLTVGGYGEAVYSRNFYSDNVYRYSRPGEYAGDPSHGSFDIPHAVIYLGYDFGKGWSMQTEIEFEHTGTGSAVEKEFTEAGEWESEIEKGGELELEQFWIQKSFSSLLNIRAGHLVVPVGGLNYAHEPLNYFTVYRPEGEYTILPSTWHDTGISLWGRTPHWRYEVLVTAGLDGFMFDRDHFVHYGAKSPYEYRVANQLGYAARVDNFSLVALYPAVFLLAVGIMVGAVWANISWGCYWSWDPKETWALITFLVYAFILHGRVLKPLQRPRVFHALCIAAFLCVLITWLGVNLVLGGMHSYA